MKIYFEIHTNYKLKTKCVKNIRIDHPNDFPHQVNSSGSWGFRICDGLNPLIIDQNWVDIELYKPYHFSNDTDEFMKKLLRKEKLKSIRNKIYNKKSLSL